VTLADFTYETKKLERGYNNRTLYVNLSEMKVASKPVSQKMKNTFTGGRGFNIWLLWNALPKDRIVKWDDPENEVCLAAGHPCLSWRRKEHSSVHFAFDRRGCGL